MPNENQTTEDVSSQVQSSGNQNSDNDNVWNKQLGGETGKNLRKNNTVRRVGLGLALLIFAGAFLAIGAAVGANMLEDESKDLVEEPIISDETELQEETEEEGDAIDAVVEEIVNDGCFDEIYESILSYDIAFLYDNCKFTVQGEVIPDEPDSEFSTELVVILNKENNSTMRLQFIETPIASGGNPYMCVKTTATQINARLARIPSEIASQLLYFEGAETVFDFTYVPGMIDPRNIDFSEDGKVTAELPDLGYGQYSLETITQNADYCKSSRTWYSKSGKKNYEDLEYSVNSGPLILFIKGDITDNSNLTEEELAEFDEIIKSLTY